MSEFPRPIRLPGESPPPREPYETTGEPLPSVVDDDTDLYGAEDAAARLAERLKAVEPVAARTGADGRPMLAPPMTSDRDRIEGPATGAVALVVFGAHGTPWSRTLGDVLSAVRGSHLATVGVAWRHYPDPAAHPRAAVLALAIEAAAVHGRFWSLTRELLRLHHHDPADLHAAMVRAGLEPERTVDEMRAGTGSDRIAIDVASALASGVTAAPALFVDGERYHGELGPSPVLAALDDAIARARVR